MTLVNGGRARLNTLFKNRDRRSRKSRRNLTHVPAVERLEQLLMLTTVVEVEPNDVLGLATALNFTEDPAGSHFYTSLGTGAIGTTTDVDYWGFSAHAGDAVTISGDGGSGSNAIYIELRNASNQIIAQAGDTATGHPQISNFILPDEGAYYVKARTNNSNNTLSSYDIRVDLPRGISGESEPNSTAATASPIVLSPGGSGHAVGVASGNITTSGDVDTFSLGSLRAGDQIDVALPASLKPGVSTLDPTIQILNPAGAVVATATGYGLPDGTNHAKFTATADDIYYARVSANTGATAGPQALYLLKADIQAAGTAAVVNTSLPTALAGNKALLFDGANDHVAVADSASLHTSSVTLEGWVNFSSLDSNLRQVFGKQVGSGDNDSYGIWYRSGTLYAGVGDSSGVAQITAGFTPTIGTWYHLAFTYDFASGIQKLLINGAPVASATTSKVIGYDANPFIIGGDTTSGAFSYPFAGRIDEARLWNFARPQADIQADMTRSLTGSETGLAGYWRFEQGSGATAVDLTANHNDGTLGGLNSAFVPTWITSGLPAVAGDAGALSFDGANDFVQLNPTVATDFSGGMTFEVWAYPTAVTSWARFFDFGNGASSDNILLARNGTSNNLSFQVYNGGSAGALVTATNAITLNTWQHFAVVLSNTGDVTLYKNGAVIATGTTNVPRNISRAYNYLGRSNWSADGYYGGRIDEVSLWNTPLSQAAIQANMGTQLAGNESGLVAYYKLDEGSGLTASDATSKHNDGALGNVTGSRPAWTASGAPLYDLATTVQAALAIDRFSVTFNEDLLATSAVNPSNYSLIEAGPDGLFGTSDDHVYALTPSYGAFGSRTVNFSVAPNPLQPGHYQFRTLAGLTDRAGVPSQPIPATSAS